MSQPILVVRSADGGVVAANAAAAQLFHGGSDTPAAQPQHFPFDLAELGAGANTRWLRGGDGRRRYVQILVGEHPQDSGLAVVAIADAGAAALKAALLPALDTVLNDAADHGALNACLGRICERLAELLALPLVRVLKADGGGLHELVARGEPGAVEAARAVAEHTGHGGTGAAALALEHHAPAHLRIEHGGDNASHTVLHDLGVRAAAAWPLSGLDEGLVLEFLALGAQDLAAEPTWSALQELVPWIAAGLARSASQQPSPLLAEAMEQAGNPLVITDVEGRIVWVNAAFSRTYGYAAKDLIGQTPRILQSGRHGARFYRDLWGAVLAGHVWSGEIVDLAADGKQITVRQTITPLRRDGRIRHFLSIHTDITAQAEMTTIDEAERGVDTATGLATRAAFEEACAQAFAADRVSHKHPALMLVAVENLVGGIPALEPDAAAFVRSVLGERIRGVLPAETVAGTLGTYDFAILAPAGAAALAALGERLGTAIRAPLPLLGDTLRLHCTCAVAAVPEDGTSFNELRRAAERRLVQAEALPGSSAARPSGTTPLRR